MSYLKDLEDIVKRDCGNAAVQARGELEVGESITAPTWEKLQTAFLHRLCIYELRQPANQDPRLRVYDPALRELIVEMLNTEFYLGAVESEGLIQVFRIVYPETARELLPGVYDQVDPTHVIKQEIMSAPSSEQLRNPDSLCLATSTRVKCEEWKTAGDTSISGSLPPSSFPPPQLSDAGTLGHVCPFSFNSSTLPQSYNLCERSIRP